MAVHRPKEPTLSVLRGAIAFLVAVTLGGGVLARQVNRRSTPLHTFEHVGMNIFVPVTVTGPTGASETENLILDSGTNRTTLDFSVASALGLRPYRRSRNTTASGTAVRYTAKIRRLCSLSQCADNLEVLIDDMSPYTTAYGRRVGGLLGMDFLKKYIVLIDFSNSRIGYLSAGVEPQDSAKFKAVRMFSEEGLFLVDATLPNGKSVRLLLDTGYDSPADALLYDFAAGDFQFVPLSRSEIRDANGSYSVEYGEIDSLKLGDIIISPAFVELSKQISAETSLLRYAGMIGIFPFRSRIVAFDYPELKLLVEGKNTPGPNVGTRGK